MQLFQNILTLRGFLGKDAEVPSSEGITDVAYAVLTLCIESGTWKKTTNEWIPWTAWYRIICPGPFFCGFTRGMRQGAYIEIEGTLHIPFYDRPVVIGSHSIGDKRPAYEVHATQIRRLESPPVGVDEGNDG
jgi:hypothetical protein